MHIASSTTFFIFVLFFLSSQCAARKADCNESVAIIGAGVSGISTAYNLVRNGYTNVTIFEATNRVGGFVTSVTYKGVEHEATVYCLLAATYWRFMRAVEGAGGSFCRMNISVANTGAHPTVAEPVNAFLARSFVLRTGLDVSIFQNQFEAQVARYTALYKDLYDASFLDRSLRTPRLFPKKSPSRAKRELLALPMLHFLKRFNLDLLTPFFMYITDTQAYGPIQTTPALYYLAWVPPAAFAVPDAYTSCESAQNNIERLAGALGPSVSFSMNANVSHVTRGDDHAVVTLSDTGKALRFKHVTVTGRFAQEGTRGPMVYPFSATERRAAAMLEELQPFAGLWEASRRDALPTEGLLTVDGDAILDARHAHRFYFAASLELRGVGNSANPYADTPTVTRFSGIMTYRERSVGARLDGDHSALARENAAALTRWDNATWTPVRTYVFDGFFQRWRPREVAQGLPWVMAENQGSGRVYYVNAAACGFESIGHLFDCATHLVNDFF